MSENALATLPDGVIEVPEPEKVVDPVQARTESVAKVLDAAYARASMLNLTPEESKALLADFPDHVVRLGANGDPNLAYIEHAYLRERLISVLGPGAVTPILRRTWTEEIPWKQQKAKRLYADMVLLIRGCVAGEGVASHTYYPNDRTDYSDALKSAKSNAFRECCKEFGVGLQMWRKEWVEQWKVRNKGIDKAVARAKDKESPPASDAEILDNLMGPEPPGDNYPPDFVKKSNALVTGWKAAIAIAKDSKTLKLIDAEIVAEWANLTDYHQDEMAKNGRTLAVQKWDKIKGK